MACKKIYGLDDDDLFDVGDLLEPSSHHMAKVFVFMCNMYTVTPMESDKLR